MPETFKGQQAVKVVNGSFYLLVPEVLRTVMKLDESAVFEMEFDWVTEKLVFKVKKLVVLDDSR